MVNTELLEKTLSYIETHPEEWDQEEWHCGTSYCFAGHAARLANGGTLPFVFNENVQYIKDRIFFELEDTRSEINPRLSKFKQEHIEYEAQVALGLDQEQADNLFSPTNTLKRLRMLVQDLIKQAERHEQ